MWKKIVLNVILLWLIKQIHLKISKNLRKDYLEANTMHTVLIEMYLIVYSFYCIIPKLLFHIFINNFYYFYKTKHILKCVIEREIAKIVQNNYIITLRDKSIKFINYCPVENNLSSNKAILIWHITQVPFKVSKNFNFDY